MRKIFYLLILTSFLSCLSSDSNILVTNSGQAQGTYYHIKYMSSFGEDYHLQIDSILKEVDNSLSIYNSNSLISRLNNGEKLKIDSLFKRVFLSANKVFLETEGNFDCTVSPLVNAWGFYKDDFGDSIIVDTLRFKSILQYVGFHKVKIVSDSLLIPKKMRLDFNSLAQGFTVDLIGEYLMSKNINNYMIEIGGEILAKGMNDSDIIWRIGVDKPKLNIDANNRFQFILNLKDKSLATSGNYRKFYVKEGEKYSHIINPFTGFPSNNKLLSVSVIHDSCMLADAYATAFMVMGVEKTKQFVKKNSDIEIYLIYTSEDGEWQTYISPEMVNRIIN